MTGADQNVTPEMRSGMHAGMQEGMQAGMHVDAEEAYRTPRWLIGLVVVLGVAFLGMLAVIVIKIMNGDGPIAAKEAPAAVESVARDPQTTDAPLPAAEAAQDFAVTRPAGAKLISSELHGREIMLHFRTPDGTDTLIVLNRMTGQQSRVTIAP